MFLKLKKGEKSAFLNLDSKLFQEPKLQQWIDTAIFSYGGSNEIESD